jgi:ubiquitin-protein ligase E3 C
LSTRPFSFEPQPLLHAQFIHHVLTLPLLPNRIPILSLVSFSANTPLASLDGIDAPAVVDALEPLARVHLLANATTFLPPPRFASLSKQNLAAYITLLNTIIASLPPASLEAQDKPPNGIVVEDEDEEFTITEASTSSAGSLSRRIESRAALRIESLLSPQSLAALLRVADDAPQVFALFANACTLWPGSRTKILLAAVAHGGPAMIKSLWRDWVRNSPIGRDPAADPRLLADVAHASGWPPLIFLLQTYTQMLLTMGDEEFFSAPGAPRNPLNLAEVTELVWRALRISWALYMYEDQAIVKDGRVPGLAMRWETARSEATQFLQSVHARE